MTACPAVTIAAMIRHWLCHLMLAIAYAAGGTEEELGPRYERLASRREGEGRPCRRWLPVPRTGSLR